MADALFAELLGPGVHGYKVEQDDATYYPFVEAVNEGSGEFGRWLDSLPRDRAHRIPNVINPRLAAMLERRGWRTVTEYAPEFEEDVVVYELPTQREEPSA